MNCLFIWTLQMFRLKKHEKSSIRNYNFRIKRNVVIYRKFMETSSFYYILEPLNSMNSILELTQTVHIIFCDIFSLKIETLNSIKESVYLISLCPFLKLFNVMNSIFELWLLSSYHVLSSFLAQKEYSLPAEKRITVIFKAFQHLVLCFKIRLFQSKKNLSALAAR